MVSMGIHCYTGMHAQSGISIASWPLAHAYEACLHRLIASDWMWVSSDHRFLLPLKPQNLSCMQRLQYPSTMHNHRTKQLWWERQSQKIMQGASGRQTCTSESLWEPWRPSTWRNLNFIASYWDVLRSIVTLSLRWPQISRENLHIGPDPDIEKPCSFIEILIPLTGQSLSNSDPWHQVLLQAPDMEARPNLLHHTINLDILRILWALVSVRQEKMPTCSRPPRLLTVSRLLLRAPRWHLECAYAVCFHCRCPLTGHCDRYTWTLPEKLASPEACCLMCAGSCVCVGASSSNLMLLIRSDGRQYWRVWKGGMMR